MSRGLSDQLIYACLSLPFAMNTTSISSSQIIYLSKGFEIRQYAGVDIVSTFQKHLNDTVGASFENDSNSP